MNSWLRWLLLDYRSYDDSKTIKENSMGTSPAHPSLSIRFLGEVQKELDRKKKSSRDIYKTWDRPKKELDFGGEVAIVSSISKEHYLLK